jgi:hypothetical protein
MGTTTIGAFAVDLVSAGENAATPGDSLISTWPTGWMWAAVIVVIVFLVVAGLLIAKALDQRFTARIVKDFGTSCLPQIAELNKPSSVGVAAEVLTATAELVRAFADVIRALFGREDSDSE